jgi:hypothetical protein
VDRDERLGADAGSTAHVQAWCQQGFFGPGVTYSFTNAAAVTF